MLIYIWFTEWYRQYRTYRFEWYDDQWKIIWREWEWICHAILHWRQYSSTSLDGMTEHLSGVTDRNSSYLSQQLTSRYEHRTFWIWNLKAIYMIAMFTKSTKYCTLPAWCLITACLTCGQHSHCAWLRHWTNTGKRSFTSSCPWSKRYRLLHLENRIYHKSQHTHYYKEQFYLPEM